MRRPRHSRLLLRRAHPQPRQEGTLRDWAQVSAQDEAPLALAQCQYYRVCRVIRMLLNGSLPEPAELPALTCLLQATSPRGAIAQLYAYSQEASKPGVSKAHMDWLEELELVITNKRRAYCCTPTPLFC
ncbi:hypothetical protein NDU88_002072 [Pleurodeles waltl]|uniref:Uncharacterized protein n=1 Tax=Pleurodeles waltl TaxID=8319 RepID=A0AAV7KRW5_PLEWA|nr:hypothetical protein NDU88_002072 [Pleurodeles waltl]